LPEATENEPAPARLSSKKTRENLEQLLLYYEVELSRLQIEYLRRRLFGRTKYGADAAVDDSTSTSSNVP